MPHADCRHPLARTMFAAAIALCAALPLLHTPPAGGDSARVGDTEWPQTWDGKRLRPLALSAVEERFAARFPGRVVRLTDGDQVLVWREVNAPTRMLHPAADCYRGLGYRVEHTQLERDEQRQMWRCFDAERDGQRLRVCERIVDNAGMAWTDTSSWFWAARLGQSSGPWQAITTARSL